MFDKNEFSLYGNGPNGKEKTFIHKTRDIFCNSLREDKAQGIPFLALQIMITFISLLSFRKSYN